MLTWKYNGVASDLTVVVRDGTNALIPVTIEQISVMLPDLFASEFDKIETDLRDLLARSFQQKFMLHHEDQTSWTLVDNGASVVHMREKVTGQMMARHVWACCAQLMEPVIALTHNLVTFRLNLRTEVKMHRAEYVYEATADEARGLVRRNLIRAHVPLAINLDIVNHTDSHLVRLLYHQISCYYVREDGEGTGKANERKVLLVGDRQGVRPVEVGIAILKAPPERSVIKTFKMAELEPEMARLKTAGTAVANLVIVADVVSN